MLRENQKEKEFPWQCPKCLKRTVMRDKLDLSIEVRYEGRLHVISLKGLPAAVCSSCNERVFTSEADEAVDGATREQLHLLSREQIQRAL